MDDAIPLNKPTFTIAEFAEIFEVCENTVREGVHRKEIPATKIRNQYRIPGGWVREKIGYEVVKAVFIAAFPVMMTLGLQLLAA